MACQGYTKSPLLGSTLVFFRVANQLTFREKNFSLSLKERLQRTRDYEPQKQIYQVHEILIFLGG